MVLEELRADPLLVGFWRSTHTKVTTEVVIAGKTAPGPDMEDGFIQGKILSTKALLITVEFVGRRWADEMNYHRMVASSRAFAEDVGIVSEHGIKPMVIYILVVRQAKQLVGADLSPTKCTIIAPDGLLTPAEIAMLKSVGWGNVKVVRYDVYLGGLLGFDITADDWYARPEARYDAKLSNWRMPGFSTEEKLVGHVAHLASLFSYVEMYMPIPERLRRKVMQDLRATLGTRGHLSDELLLHADVWVGVQTPPVDLVLRGLAARCMFAACITEVLDEIAPVITGWPKELQDQCVAWQLIRAQGEVAQMLRIPKQRLFQRFEETLMRKQDSLLAVGGIALPGRTVERQEHPRGIVIHVDGSGPLWQYRELGLVDCDHPKAAATWGWVATSGKSIHTVSRAARGEVQTSPGGVGYYGALKLTNHSGEMTSVIDALETIEAERDEPWITAMQNDDGTVDITFNYDNGVGVCTAKESWESRAEPGLELTLWRKWENALEVRVSLGGHWMKSHTTWDALGFGSFWEDGSRLADRLAESVRERSWRGRNCNTAARWREGGFELFRDVVLPEGSKRATEVLAMFPRPAEAAAAKPLWHAIPRPLKRRRSEEVDEAAAAGDGGGTSSSNGADKEMQEVDPLEGDNEAAPQPPTPEGGVIREPGDFAPGTPVLFEEEEEEVDEEGGLTPKDEEEEGNMDQASDAGAEDEELRFAPTDDEQSESSLSDDEVTVAAAAARMPRGRDVTLGSRMRIPMMELYHPPPEGPLQGRVVKSAKLQRKLYRALKAAALVDGKVHKDFERKAAQIGAKVRTKQWMAASQMFKRRRVKGRLLWARAWMLVNRVSSARHKTAGARRAKLKQRAAAVKMHAKFVQDEPEQMEWELGLPMALPPDIPLEEDESASIPCRHCGATNHSASPGEDSVQHTIGFGTLLSGAEAVACPVAAAGIFPEACKPPNKEKDVWCGEKDEKTLASLGDKAEMESRLVGFHMVQTQYMLEAYVGTLPAEARQQSNRNAKMNTLRAHRDPRREEKLRQKRALTKARYARKKEETNMQNMELEASMLETEWTVPFMYIEHRSSAEEIARLWFEQPGSPVTWHIGETPDGLHLRAVGTRLGVEAFRQWVVSAFAPSERTQAAMNELPVKVRPPPRPGFSGFTNYERQWQGFCRWPGCTHETFGDNHKERRRHEAWCPRRPAGGVPYPEVRGSKRPLDPQGPSPDHKALRALSFSSFGDGLTEKQVEARSTAALRWAIRESDNPQKGFGFTIREAGWQALHAKVIARGLSDTLRRAPAALHLRIRKNSCGDLELRGTWENMRAISAYLLTIAFTYGGRYRGPVIRAFPKE